MHDWKWINSNRVPAVWTSQATNGNNKEAGKEMYFTSKEMKESLSRDRMTWITINATNNGKYLCWLSLDLGGNISVVNICSFRKSQSALSTSHVLSINASLFILEMFVSTPIFIDDQRWGNSNHAVCFCFCFCCQMRTMICFFLLPINFPIHWQDFNDFHKEGVDWKMTKTGVEIFVIFSIKCETPQCKLVPVSSNGLFPLCCVM